MSAFGAVLARERAKQGISQYRLAERAEVDFSSISRLETGNRNPSRTMVEKLIGGLGLAGREANTFRLAAGFAPR